MSLSNLRNLAVVILAAGKGKRMLNPSMAKVMALLDGKPLIHHVLDQLAGLNPAKIIIVVGHQKDAVIEYVTSLNIANLNFVEQKEQLGTGHAVAQVESELADFVGDVLILAGDVPLLLCGTLQNFIIQHNEAKADVSDLTAYAPAPKGYGRIVRSSDGEFNSIVEEKDADDEIRKIAEINSGIFLVHPEALFSALKAVSNNNAQGEYYLTDIISILRERKAIIKAFPAKDFFELQGVNSVEELKAAEEYYLKRKSNS